MPVSAQQKPALFETRGLRWKRQPALSSSDFCLDGNSVYLHGTKRLFDAMVEPASHLLAGEFRILNQAAREVLRSGAAALCPSRLPAPDTTRLIDALTMSAGLLGYAKSDVLRCLEQVGLAPYRKTRLLALSAEQERRAGIAHGLITNPKLLVFTQPFFDLPSGARQSVSQLMEQVTRDRSWMLAGEANCSVSHKWRERATWIIYAEGEQLLATRTALPTPAAYFLHVKGRAKGLTAELRNTGAVVTPSTNPQVLLIEALDAAQITGVCATFSECSVVSLEPAEEAGFRNSHAKSAL